MTIRRIVDRFAPGVASLREPGVLARVLTLSGLAWGCESVMVTVCAFAVGLPIGLALAPSILLAINLAIAVPAAPAGAGPFEQPLVPRSTFPAANHASADMGMPQRARDWGIGFVRD